MNRTLGGFAAAAALSMSACGVDDSALIVRNDDTQTERFEGGQEEAELRTSATYDTVFEAAGTEFNVPPALLKSMSYALTRYEMVASEGEFDGVPGAYGVMALSPELIAEAAPLAGVTEDAAKTDVTANIRTAAAWLSKQADVQQVNREQLLSWSPVIGEYTKLEDVAGRQAFVRGEVYSSLKLGVGRFSDELEVAGKTQALEAEVGEYSEVLQGLARAPDYGAGVWRPSPNFNSRGGQRPKFVVIHTCEGAYSGCWGWLTNSRAGASAHYVVNSNGTEISQLVRESDRAWHVAADYECSRNGNQMCNLNGASSNTHSVGIEHAGFASQTTFPAGQIDASAKLVCNITKDWGIPRDRFHVVGHGQLQPWNRTDPGRNWPWSSFITKINSACGGTGGGGGGTTPPPAPGALVIDSNNSNNNQARGYVQVSANWKSSSNVAGYYGSGYWYANTAEVSDGAAFFFKLDAAGSKTIDAWWTAATDRSTATSFVAFNARGERVGAGTVNQTRNGGKWNVVGTFNFTAGWNKIVVSRWQNPGKVVIADAVRVR
ncbi:MAG: N-acetylmuramoyl-L-alanine amidase [Archangium gephyra]|uniref:N-acetylmuramoyl-L-alanine amidase n=1 Tax=Archangium gephyra TaxID=48 RepID=A0A2W5T5Y8_9BACT|nr:MAG: N-acetylmuramoyl-L-alanine amidase [Archangium gephyra]